MNKELAVKCAEILDWHRTGILVGGEVRKEAKKFTDQGIMEHTALRIAETQIAEQAMRFVIDNS